jgi:hypothetical protein
MNTENITKEFFELLENLQPEELDKKIGKRTIKEVIAHLVGWEKEAFERLDETWRTKEKPWFLKTDNFDEFNEKSIENYKNFTPEQLLNEWKKWQKKLDDKIEEIGEDKLREDMELFDWVFDEGDENHYLEHLNQIKKVLGLMN